MRHREMHVPDAKVSFCPQVSRKRVGPLVSLKQLDSDELIWILCCRKFNAS